MRFGEALEELAEDIRGVRFLVVLAGALGPILCDLLMRWAAEVSGAGPPILLTAPAPILLASLLALEVGGGGPAVSLGALLGYSSLAALRLLHPRLGGPPPLCGACSTPLIYALAGPPGFSAVVMSLVPASVVYRETSEVPRLLPLMYAAALLANFATCAACLAHRWEAYLGDSFHPIFLSLVASSMALDVILSAISLRKARAGTGGVRLLLAALTLYAIVGSLGWG